MKIFISGHSDGLGFALMQSYLQSGNEVFGLSRRQVRDTVSNQLKQISCDLAQVVNVKAAMHELVGDSEVDVVFLNAGVLGPLKQMQSTTIAEIERVMNINVWSNKFILDYLLQRQIMPAQIIMISSGAGIKGGYGWSAYALSKSTLNMLARLYAHEFASTHICALAPGIVDTAMQAQIRDDAVVDVNTFTDFARLRQAKANGSMPSADQAAASIVENLGALRRFESGSYVDLRDILA